MRYSGGLPVSFFLTILNPFHSIWETLAVVSRALSLSLLTQQLQKRLSNENSLLSLPCPLPVLVSSETVFFSLCLCLCRSLSSEQRAACWRRTEQASPSSTDAEERMVMLDESAGLQQAPLPLSPPSPLLPAAVRPVACSAGRSEPAQPPPSPISYGLPLGFWLACQPSASPPFPSGVSTFALWLAPSRGRHTPTSACFGREKAFWIPAKQSIAAVGCAWVSRAEQRGAELCESDCSLGHYGNRMPAQHCVYKLAITGCM